MSENRAQDVTTEAVPARVEPRWPAALALLVGIILTASLPAKFTLGPPWILPILEAALLPPLIFVLVHRVDDEHTPWEHLAYIALGEQSQVQRTLFLALIAVISVENIASLVLLADDILLGHHKHSGYQLIFAAFQIWLTNVLVFALWYWSIDRGGPGRRMQTPLRLPDFLFPQMTARKAAPPGWMPSFLDYLYVSFTNAMAFSPTDTMPLTERVKLLMAVQSLASLATVGLVAARAVNILS